MGRDYKLIWQDNGQTKTALGMGFRMHTESVPFVIEFLGFDGPIVFTANSFDGKWMIK